MAAADSATCLAPDIAPEPLPCLHTGERGQSPLRGVEGDLGVQEALPSPPMSWKQFPQRPLPVETEILTSLTRHTDQSLPGIVRRG